jgi:LCP family protein required for cell wall assembly
MRPPSKSDARRRQRASRRRRPLLSAALIVFGFVLSGSGGAGTYFAPVVAAAFQQSSQKVSVDVHPSATPSVGAPATQPPADQGQTQSGAFTVLLMGSDDDAKFNGSTPLTQSMILVRIEPATKKVTMLSIPRDLYVPFYTPDGSVVGHGKIDQAYEHGMEREAIATVEENFNVRVDEFVWIGLVGLIKLIDLLGGVDVITTYPVLDDLYPEDINTKNPYGLHRLAVLPGPQHMDGKHAMEYVRSRHSDARQDFGRSFRQQQVLVALRSKAKALSPADLPQIATSFQGQVKTSFNLADVRRIRQLLSLASQVQTSNISQVVMVGGYTSDVWVGNEQALQPDWPAIRSLVHQHFPPAV